MASLLTLFYCAVSYFTKPSETNNEMNNTLEAVDYEMSDEISEITDGEVVLSRRSVFNDVNDDYMWKECITCVRYINPQYYVIEERICKCCQEISLGKDNQCFTCGEAKHITLFRKPKCFTVSNAHLILAD
jgi:hypothetical protein